MLQQTNRDRVASSFSYAHCIELGMLTRNYVNWR